MEIRITNTNISTNFYNSLNWIQAELPWFNVSVIENGVITAAASPLQKGAKALERSYNAPGYSYNQLQRWVISGVTPA